MARKKVQLAWIENQTARKSTFRKRRENLIKKVREISVLAGSDACGIILSPFEGDPPLFYPPSITETLNRYLSLPEIDQFKRMVTVESYMKDEISKMKAMVQKERRNCREMEVCYTMNSIHVHGRSIESLSCDETSQLFWYFEELKNKCELMINSFVTQPSSIMAMVQVLNNENLMNDHQWLDENYNGKRNFDLGFDPNLKDHPYHDMSSFASSSNNGGFMNNNGGMIGPSGGVDPPCLQPEPDGSHDLGFFSNCGRMLK